LASRAEAPRVCQRAKGARAPKRCDPVATQGSLAAPARGDLRVWLTLRRSPVSLLCAFRASSMKHGRHTPHWRPQSPKLLPATVLRRVSTRAPGYRASIGPRDKPEDKPTLPGAAPFPRNRTDRSRSLGGEGRRECRGVEGGGDKNLAEIGSEADTLGEALHV